MIQIRFKFDGHVKSELHSESDQRVCVGCRRQLAHYNFERNGSHAGACAGATRAVSPALDRAVVAPEPFQPALAPKLIVDAGIAVIHRPMNFQIVISNFVSAGQVVADFHLPWMPLLT